MNLFINLHNLISSLYKSILYIYTYKHRILYIFKSSLILISLFTNTSLYLSSACLTVEPKLKLELDLFDCKINEYKLTLF